MGVVIIELKNIYQKKNVEEFLVIGGIFDTFEKLTVMKNYMISFFMPLWRFLLGFLKRF